jgi:hypothetical protein
VHDGLALAGNLCLRRVSSLLSQTIVLAHGSSLAVFASSNHGFKVPPLPDLHAFGVAVTDGGAFCQGQDMPGNTCSLIYHAANVAVGTDSANVPNGTTQQIGWLSFTNTVFLELKDRGACDAAGSTLVAGFSR